MKNSVFEATGIECELTNYTVLDIGSLFNDDAISFDSNRGDSSQWVRETTFPAEELPESNSIVVVNGVPFMFPSKRDECLNNFTFDEQYLHVPAIRARALHFICGGDNGNYDEDIDIYLAESLPARESLSIPDVRALIPILGSRIGFRCSHSHLANDDYFSPRTMWHQRVALKMTGRTMGIGFGFNPFVHVFCATAELEDGEP